MRFIDVQVEEHEDLPEGCGLRFRAQGETRVVTRIRYESESGVDGEWTLVGARSDGTTQPAMATPVDDSGAGISILIVGGDHGLRLLSATTFETVAEPYLLLSPEALVL